MADEPKPVAEPTEPKDSGKIVFDTQEDFDAVIQRRVAKVQSKYQDYDTIQAELVKLREAEQKRKEAELTELDKYKKQIEAKDARIAELEPHLEWRKSWEEKEAERAESAMDGLTDKQKDIVRKLPLEERMDAINEFKPVNTANVNTSKGGRSVDPTVPSHDELMEIKFKYGINSVQYREALKKKFPNG
jgi:DNA repair exonuclease SbcCD ATPase subunit